MPSKHVFNDILAKIDRANKHIGDLDSLWDACRVAHPNRTRIERDPQSGDLHYFVEDMTPIPIQVPLIAGDAIQNLRTALDHLAWAMVKRAGGKVDTQTSFPIFESATDYADAKKGVTRKVQGLSSFAMQKLASHGPYKGGNDKLWILHRLNNIDKHRLLLTVGHDVGVRTLLPSEKRSLGAKFRVGRPGADSFKFEGMFMNFVQPITFVPLQIGDKLFSVDATDADENMQFSIDIAINETGTLRGIPLILILRLISAEVSLIVNDFAPFL
jgi:hypothetical protein